LIETQQSDQTNIFVSFAHLHRYVHNNLSWAHNLVLAKVRQLYGRRRPLSRISDASLLLFEPFSTSVPNLVAEQKTSQVDALAARGNQNSNL
jgi:hypothetical protein